MSRAAQHQHDASPLRGATIGLPVLMLVALAMSLATAAVEATGSGRPAARIELRGLVDGGSVGQATFAVRAGAMAGGTQPLPAGGAACGTPIWHDADTPTCRRWLVLTQLDLPPPASA